MCIVLHHRAVWSLSVLGNKWKDKAWPKYIWLLTYSVLVFWVWRIHLSYKVHTWRWNLRCLQRVAARTFYTKQCTGVSVFRGCPLIFAWIHISSGYLGIGTDDLPWTHLHYVQEKSSVPSHRKLLNVRVYGDSCSAYSFRSVLCPPLYSLILSVDLHATSVSWNDMEGNTEE